MSRASKIEDGKSRIAIFHPGIDKLRLPGRSISITRVVDTLASVLAIGESRPAGPTLTRTGKARSSDTEDEQPLQKTRGTLQAEKSRSGCYRGVFPSVDGFTSVSSRLMISSEENPSPWA